MCGIIGYTGRHNAVPYLIQGLKNLEYRGYDSAGIALIDEDGISVLKRKGRVSVLESAADESLKGKTGIGHTRWATHGEPSQLNAHPHLSENGIFAVVHNGIIENCDELRQHLKQDGYAFISDTDTEVISQLLEKNYEGDLIGCLYKTARLLEGSFAVAALHRDYPGTIICLKKRSPLIIAKADDGFQVLSDISSCRGITSYYALDDGETAFVNADSVRFFSSEGLPTEKAPSFCSSAAFCRDKGNFPHYMLKEIYEQPCRVADTIDAYLKNGNIVFPGLKLSESELKAVKRIHFVACGSAYHAALCAEYVFRRLCTIDVSVHIASEFRYDSISMDKDSLVVAVSQSGETADTLAALISASQKGAHTLAIVNVPSSAMAKLAHSVIFTPAGAEISVATTKAYSCQVAVLFLLGCLFSKITPLQHPNNLSEKLTRVPKKIESELTDHKKLIDLADRLKSCEHIYFIGRNTDYALAMEGALKMKEISYIHCEAYAAGELKHGTISLIEKGTPVIAVCLRNDIFSKTLSAIKEVKARGAFVIALTQKGREASLTDADIVITCSKAQDDNLSALTGIVPLQLLSYYTALARGCDIDKPRNLAKSVTVE